MPFLWKCYIWVMVGVVGYIVGAARWALDKNRDKQNKNQWTHKLRIENTSGSKWNKNRWA